MTHEDAQSSALKNWKLISQLILNTKSTEFHEWIQQINPEFYKRLWAHKASKKKQEFSQRRSSKSVSMLSDADSDSEFYRRNRKKMLKKVANFKIIVHKVLFKGMFKHITDLQNNIETKSK